MNWLRAIIAGLLDSVLSWGQKQAEKPKVTEDANTPKPIRDSWDGYISNAPGVRDEKRNDNRQK